MKKYFVTTCLGLSLVIPATVVAVDTPESYEEKISYTMGYEMGEYVRSMSNDMQEQEFLLGIKDAWGEEKAKLSSEQMIEVKKKFAQKMQEAQERQLTELKEKNLVEGQAFLKKNKGEKGVAVTKSGLQYKVLNEGSGELVTEQDIVTVNYKGTFIDGTEFDSTEKHGKPVQLQVNQVIPGWTEALQMMRPGSKLRIVIPPALAYGEQGAPPVIEPNSVLVFEVELLSIDSIEQQELSAEGEGDEMSRKLEEAVKKAQEAAKK